MSVLPPTAPVAEVKPTLFKWEVLVADDKKEVFESTSKNFLKAKKEAKVKFPIILSMKLLK